MNPVQPHKELGLRPGYMDITLHITKFPFSSEQSPKERAVWQNFKFFKSWPFLDMFSKGKSRLTWDQYFINHPSKVSWDFTFRGVPCAHVWAGGLEESLEKGLPGASCTCGSLPSQLSCTGKILLLVFVLFIIIHFSSTRYHLHHHH